MRALSLSLVVCALAAAVPVAAQMPGPPPESIRGIPLAPVRLPDGHPNWTGFWVPAGGFLEVYRGPSGLGGAPKGGINIPSLRHDIPELKSPYKEQYEAIGKQAAAGALPDPVAACFPPGMPSMMVMVYGMEILQTPKVISITSEWQAATRRVWMDLKQHPPAEELDDTYAGHSIGHWEDYRALQPDIAGRPGRRHDHRRSGHVRNAVEVQAGLRLQAKLPPERI
jgi:hypothetical protein